MGSMVPDFEYFLRMRAECDFSHTVAGIFLFDLPVGVVMTFIFYNIAIGPLLDNTPKFLSSRFLFLKNSDWNTYFTNNKLKVCFCIIAGAISHLIWDNFTHQHGHFSHVVPGLFGNLHVFGIHITLPHRLQHLSTVVGMGIVAVYIWFLPVDVNHQPVLSLKYWSIAAIIFIIVLCLRLSFGLGENRLNNFAVSFISAGMIALIATPLLLFKRK